MDISPYFAELIAQKDHVIVPGLGKFYQSRISGYYDEASKSFFPPSQKIEFTTEYRHDDKLVQFISQKSNISLTSAYAILDEYVKDLKAVLKNEPVTINSLGKLKIVDDKITFFSDENTQIINEDFFGLPVVDTQKIAPIVIREEAKDYSLAQQALNTAMLDDDEDEKPKSIIGRLILIFILFLLIGGAIALFYLKPEVYQNLLKSYKNNKIGLPGTLSKDLSDAEAVQKADSVYDSGDIEAKLKAKGFEVEKAQDSTDVLVSENAIPKNNGIRYEIIIGLYEKRGQAEARVKELKANGINSYIIEDADGPLIKISCAVFNTKTEANKELKRVQEELNPRAYTLPIKTLKK
jgi:hypothetical protein